MKKLKLLMQDNTLKVYEIDDENWLVKHDSNVYLFNCYETMQKWIDNNVA